MPRDSHLCIELPRHFSDKLRVETMTTNYDPIATLRPVKKLKWVYLIARREKTFLCGFRNPAIYDRI